MRCQCYVQEGIGVAAHVHHVGRPSESEQVGDRNDVPPCHALYP